VPAIGIAVANSDGVVLASTYGDARPDRKATTETLFNVASVTKLLAAETILRLAATDAFDLDQPMAPVWVDPDVKDDPRHKELTPRHALAHQTGFPNWRFLTEDNRLSFQFKPGARPGYSGEGYNYVARFAEKLTGKTFPDLVSELVLEPAGVEKAVLGAHAPFPQDFTWSVAKDGEFKPVDTWKTWSAADDLYVTPTAFVQILTTMLGDGSLPADLEKDRRTTQFEMTEQFCSQDILANICPKTLGFGLSGVIFEYEDETVFWQGGGDLGEKAVAFYVPKRDLAVVIFSNGVDGGKLFAPIAALFYDNPQYIEFLRRQGNQ